MIQHLANHYQQTIARVLLGVFLSSWALPLFGSNAAVPALHPDYTVKYGYAPSSAEEKTFYTDYLKRGGRPAAAPSSFTKDDGGSGKETTVLAPLVGGPNKPEASSFQSVGTNDMVNLFTGDFSYNIPLLDVGGYPVNIFYSGVSSMEEEASWVGLGWNINPGTINRNMRGIPDDFNGEDVLTQTQKMKPNITHGFSLGISVELLGKKLQSLKVGNIRGSLQIGAGYSFNNYLGPALDLNLGPNFSYGISKMSTSEKSSSKDTSKLNLRLQGGVGINASSRSGTSLSGSVSLTAGAFKNNDELTYGPSLSTGYNSRSGLKELHISEQMSFSKSARLKGVGSWGNNVRIGLRNTTISFAKASYIPSLRLPVTNSLYAGSVQLGAGMFGAAVAPHARIFRQIASIEGDDVVQRKPLVGYMHMEKAQDNPDAVMDFTRLNDREVTANTTIISAPQYTYDVFSISGEGTGGTIRAYQRQPGFVRDNYTQTKDKSLSMGVDIGLPGHIGADFNQIKTPSSIGEWVFNNLARHRLKLKAGAKLSEGVYFRNPGESTVLDDNEYTGIGGTELVRLQLGGSGANPVVMPVLEKYTDPTVNPVSVNLNSESLPARKRRTQVVTMLTASEATDIGLEPVLRNYNRNITQLIQGDTLNYQALSRVDATRKAHHLSEISVTEGDGKRYVYGQPVYNLKQEDYTFTVAATPNDNDLVTYTATERSTASAHLATSAAKDGYVQITSTPAYASSFLLTGLLSPDYVDVTGNGISEDDLGSAVKFNYSKSANDFKWRTPVVKTSSPTAHANRGNLSETKDDKGLVSYGERESWYLHSIESKTMVAIFTVENRDDGKGVQNVDGLINYSDNSLQRLKKIDLYNKADIHKNGLSNAKPIKTAWFAYSYSLIGNTPGSGTSSSDNKGKLTLDSIYFTYNGQQRVVNNNRYVFQYNTGATYRIHETDRWGNYKKRADNPGGIKNSIYPYAEQNKAKADANAGAWTLSKILLPSGGQLEVTYESDDYAYVQNKRAMVMQPIRSVGREGVAGTNSLYDYTYEGFKENNRVVITVPVHCTTKEEVYRYYLEGVKQLAFKLAVRMPKGTEYIPVYATIEDYGLGTTANTIWVQLKMVNGYSPLSIAALDYLREQLPGQAFPGYDISGSAGMEQVIKMLTGMLDGLANMFTNVVKQLQNKNLASRIILAESFVRLNEAGGKKLGGGARVKKVVLKDNWNVMTGLYGSTYGQEYDYTTTAYFAGSEKVISSGVASYEPSIGGEENPFQEMVQVADKLPLGPTSYGAIEMPVMDAFFQAPVVGYSKVTVRSVNKFAKPADKKSRSGVGRQVTEFYTAKDYPVKFSHTRLPEKTGEKYFKEQAKLWDFLNSASVEARALTQGFLVETNDMHGQLKAQYSYAEDDDKTPINYTRHYYRNTGEKGLAEKFDFVHNQLGGEVHAGNMGIDIELMTDSREFIVTSASTDVQGQLDLMAPPPLPVVFMFIIPVLGQHRNEYRAVTTTKVVNYHSVLDSMVVMDKGSVVSTKNILYDAETGAVVVNRTNNEYDKPVYSTTYPAYWAYSGMGPAYKNIGAVYGNVNFRDGKIVGGMTAAEIKATFESGDELYIMSASTPVDECGKTLAGMYGSVSAKKIWALDKTKNTSSLTAVTPDMVFIDEKGAFYSAGSVRFKIIRSGKRNMLGAQASSYTSKVNPVAGTVPKLLMGAAYQVLHASAVTFKEKWQNDGDVFKKFKEVSHYIPEGANLVVNGNFSAGNTGFFTDYMVGEDPGTYQVKQTVNGCRDRSLTGNMLVADGHLVPNKVVWGQTITVVPGMSYSFSYWAQTVTSGTPAGLIIKINGIQIGGVTVLSSSACVWNQISGTWKSGTSTTATLTIVNTTTVKPQNDFAIDDIVFRSMPNCYTTIVEDCEGDYESINPYRKGLLGTFRTDRSYVYYGDRNGSVLPSGTTNIAADGYFTGTFVPYWSFNSAKNLIPTTNALWVWNSQVTRINGRGLETETQDALGIYTAAQYGYRKNLPVAIANNAQYQEIAFTGFEDVDYTEGLNKSLLLNCKENNHFMQNNAMAVAAAAEGIKAHSGSYVAKVGAGSTINTGVFSVNNSNENTMNLLFARDTLKKMNEYGVDFQKLNSVPYEMIPNYIVNQTGGHLMYHIGFDKDSIGWNPNNPNLINGLFRRFYSLTVKGKSYIKIEKEAIYYFESPEVLGEDTIGYALYRIDGESIPLNHSIGRKYYACIPVGVYYFEFTTSSSGVGTCFYQGTENCSVYQNVFSVKKYNFIISTNYGVIPSFYKSLSAVNTCTYTQPIPVTESVKNPVFTVPAGKKMLLSAWLRENCAAPCNIEKYTNGKLRLVYKDAAGDIISTEDFTAAGNIIEEWQKIEKAFTAPAGTAKVELMLVNSGSSPVYFDDIRIHPYDANMVSYVYDPVNLRLVAQQDANNYTTFYEYDEEGSLIRTKVETERGIKTVSENRSANQKSVRAIQ